jgi:hypothetical protein
MEEMFSMQSVRRLYSEDQSLGVGGWRLQLAVLSCILIQRYQATTSEDTQDIVFAEVMRRVYRLVKVLQLFVFMSYKHPIN